MATESQLPLDNVASDLDVYSYGQKLVGFSYYIGLGNERYEKLDGYEDVYLMIDHYDPSQHILNNKFVGSHAIVKYDRSVNPPQVIYLSKQTHLYSGSAEEIRTYKSVNEALCSLNSACETKLEKFNRVVDSTEFNSKAVSQYKDAIIKRETERLIVDTYYQNSVIKAKIQAVFDHIKTNHFANIDEVNAYLLFEMMKISNEGKSMCGKTLEFYDYDSIASNISNDLKNYSYVAKKEAIYNYCQSATSTSCPSVNSLKQDIDYFDGKRTVIDDLP